MCPISEAEIQEIVRRVVAQNMGAAPTAPAAAPKPAAKPAFGRSVVAVGADHGGVDLKDVLKRDLAELGYEVIDVGTQGKDAVDYPDFAAEVARLVSTGKAWRGVMIDGAGIGSCMVANKVPGVRAAMCYDDASAVNSREHNDANVLTLGAGLIGVNLARRILKIWLATDFGGGRHAGRVNKIIAVEKQYFK